MKKTMIAVALSTFILSGCASNTSNTQKGAGIGAVIGALVGKGTGDNDKKRYVWGAALGALAGGAIGSYMDKQEEEFREELADSGVEVYREGDSIRLSIPGNITFATGSDAIVTGFYPVLEDVAKVLNRYDKTKLSIEGHTDSVGDVNSNRKLSMQRANSVAVYLQATSVEANRLQTLGMGESKPIADNATAQGRQANRRVELRVIPL
ncbi:OmpA family protein [Paraglaciecola psychrophila]|uniref:OmpA/MotB protein n=1 Tax=Paraglaciecola psychrophila 170 TaxID=1129794 RepID=K7AMR2_9ALTE|nr:OmpA family protein [Paraglaciecola psychrophila]AGH42785.1 OmpA/MotB protein [Paraglaciecola psychrophila 170]GAC36680.1 inner membrane lipoprotein yiaD [Paraglaciecola psychrophila 170]